MTLRNLSIGVESVSPKVLMVVQGVDGDNGLYGQEVAKAYGTM